MLCVNGSPNTQLEFRASFDAKDTSAADWFVPVRQRSDLIRPLVFGQHYRFALVDEIASSSAVFASSPQPAVTLRMRNCFICYPPNESSKMPQMKCDGIFAQDRLKLPCDTGNN